MIDGVLFGLYFSFPDFILNLRYFSFVSNAISDDNVSDSHIFEIIFLSYLKYAFPNQIIPLYPVDKGSIV